MPSYEIIIKRIHQNFGAVWDECKYLLYRNARHYMEQHQKPLKVRIGTELTIYKWKELHNQDLTDFLNDTENNIIDEIEGDVYEGKLYKDELHNNPNCIFIKLNISTNNILVYTHETMKELILSLEDELNLKINKAIEKVKGSGWAIYRFDKMYSILHTINTARAGSYIKTPENMTFQNVD
jgi:superoxide dismutase